MKFTILGQGSAVPEHSINRSESIDVVGGESWRSDKERRILRGLYRMTGVEKRHSVLLQKRLTEDEGPQYEPLFRQKSADDMGPPIGARMEVYEERAFPLALRAAASAIERSGLSGEDITHLVTVSCSGFAAPGVDLQLIKFLSLPATVERAHIGFMGCHGALNGLRVARAFANADPTANVLLSAVELCSLHYHYGWDPEQVVANALFADGSAALVGSQCDVNEGWSIAATGAYRFPDSEDAMTWRIRDHGFVMSLSPKIPKLIAEHLRTWTESWLGKQGLALGDIGSWAVHPGGPRILSSVAAALDLERSALTISRDVLREYGNMSSPTILFILDRLQRAKAPLPCVALAFGPGLAAEAVLFESATS